jgi:hypothetical protein
MIINPLYNVLTNRPHRWCLYVLDTGKLLEEYDVEDGRYVHFTTKAQATKRNIFPTIRRDSAVTTIRKVDSGFLTTFIDYMYEDGKYARVDNDPVNYITTNPTNTVEAYTSAEQRIGNTRVGARRSIIHLGGTLTHEMDDLTASGLTSFPLFPPKPADYTKAERVHLLTTDNGYVEYVKSSHPQDTTRYAWKSSQMSGRRTIIWNSANANFLKESTTLTDNTRVDIEDVETVIDSAVSAGISALTDGNFLPADGEDITVNVAGQHVVRSDSTQYKIEMYSDATLSTLTSYILVDKSTGDITLNSNNKNIVLENTGNISISDATFTVLFDNTNNKLTLGDGTRVISIDNASTVDITDGNKNITIDGTGITLDDGTRSVVIDTSGVVISDGTRSITMNGSTVNIT